MTNTSFRKKTLLASVAMLLVAMIALGSATFAWFASQPTVTAQGLSLKSTTSTGILVLSDSEKTARTKEGEGQETEANIQWKNSTVLNCADRTGSSAPYTYATKTDAETLSPVSLFLGTPAANAEAPVTYTGASDDIYSASVNTDGFTAQNTWTTGLYAEKVYLKATGGASATITSAKVSYTAPEGTYALRNGLRVALIDEDNTSVLGVWSARGTNSFTYVTGTSSSNTASYTDALAFNSAKTISKTVTNASSAYVWVVVYLDGQDEDVKTANVDIVNLISQLTVQFSTGSLS